MLWWNFVWVVRLLPMHKRDFVTTRPLHIDVYSVLIRHKSEGLIILSALTSFSLVACIEIFSAGMVVNNNDMMTTMSSLVSLGWLVSMDKGTGTRPNLTPSFNPSSSAPPSDLLQLPLYLHSAISIHIQNNTSVPPAAAGVTFHPLVPATIYILVCFVLYVDALFKILFTTNIYSHHRLVSEQCCALHDEVCRDSA